MYQSVNTKCKTPIYFLIRISICWTTSWPQWSYWRSSPWRVLNPTIWPPAWVWRSHSYTCRHPASSSLPTNGWLSLLWSLQITFLEFFEVLLGSAEVKCPQFSQSPVDMEQPSSRSYTDNSDRSELESSSLLSVSQHYYFVDLPNIKYQMAKPRKIP